jgi:hypothetical protein
VLEGESGEPTAPEPRIGALRRAAAAIADVLVPPLCLSCHGRLSTHDALCPSCWSGIDFIRAPLCDRLGLPMPYDTGGRVVSAAAAADPPAYDRARAVARFEGVMRTLVHDLKFHDRLRAAYSGAGLPARGPSSWRMRMHSFPSRSPERGF